MIEVKTEPRTAGHQDKGKKLKQLLLCSFIVAAPLVTTVYKFVSEQRKLVQQETAIFKHRREIIKRYEGLSATELRARITSPKEAGEFIESTYGPESFCLNSARAIAYLIANDGFKPAPIVLKKQGNPIHWVCVFETGGKYGCVDNGIFGYIPPAFENVDQIVRHIERSEKLWHLSWEGIQTGLLLDEDYMNTEGLKSILDTLNRDKKEKDRYVSPHK